MKMLAKGRTGLLLLAAAVMAGGVLLYGRAMAAEQSVMEIQRENAELREILANFGKGTIDIYTSLEDLSAGKPTLAGVKMLRPSTVFEKPYYRVENAAGDTLFLAPGSVTAIRVPAGNRAKE